MNMIKTKLVLGSAGKKHPDAITVDIDPLHHPDVLHDLNVLPWPFKDGQFKEIVCHHVVEHLRDISPVMKELHRICDKDGVIYIEVPHHTSWCANVPEHFLRFNAFAFDGYLKDGLTEWVTGPKFTLVKREITFHRRFRRLGLQSLFNRYPMEYERFWAYLCPAEHLKVWLRPIK